MTDAEAGALPAVPRMLIRTAALLAEHGRDYLQAKESSAPALSAAGASTPAVILHGLLERSLRQSTTDATTELARTLLHQLVPDEARMLVALERTGWSAAVDIDNREPADCLHRATLLGREAGIVLTAYAPLYLARLIDAGLIQEAEERAERSGDYEILLADGPVLTALGAGRGVAHRTRIRRYGVELSTLGRSVMDEAGLSTR